MKYIGLVMIYFGFMSVTCHETNLISKVDMNSLMSKLEEKGFPVKKLDLLNSGEITKDNLLERINENENLIIQNGHAYHFLHFKFKMGYLEESIIIYCVNNVKGEIIDVFVNECDWCFIMSINEKNINLFEKKENLINVFNSTELTLLEFDTTESLIGECYDSIVDLKLGFIIDWGLSKVERFQTSSDKVYFSLISSDRLLVNNDFRPIVRFQTDETFLFTYGINEQKGNPEIIRYREVYYDILEDKIVKDQLSSGFIYYDVDRW